MGCVEALAGCPLSRLTATALPKGEPSMCVAKSLRKAKSRLPLRGRCHAKGMTERATRQRPAHTRVPPPSLIPKGGTRFGRGDRKAWRKPPWHRRCHQETPGEGFLRKTVHRTIFLFSCACWRYKTLGALPLLGCRLGQALDGAHRAPAPLPAFFRRKLGKELYPPTART